MTKNTIIFLCFASLVSVLINFYNGCSDKTTNPPNTPECKADTTITITDEFGNGLGGDTTDWCGHSTDGVSFGAAYPNPCYNLVHVRFHVPSEDTVKVYLLKTCSDTTTFFEGHVMPGSYIIDINDSTEIYKNTYQRVYFKSKNFSSSPYCRFYGDIKFTD